MHPPFSVKGCTCGRRNAVMVSTREGSEAKQAAEDNGDDGDHAELVDHISPALLPCKAKFLDNGRFAVDVHIGVIGQAGIAVRAEELAAVPLVTV